MSVESRIKEYREYKRLAEEALAAAESIADELKALMSEAGRDRWNVGEYKLSWCEYTRKDLDKKRLEADHGDIYAAYLRESTYKKFLVA